MSSKIEWLARPGTLPETWNMIAGCSPVSAGCLNCYAARLAAGRLRNHPRYEGVAKMENGRAQWTGKISLDASALDTPLRWKKPRTVFIASMSDLFHASVRTRYIASILARVATTPQHTYLCLTKRARRMYKLFTSGAFVHCVQLKTRRTFATEMMWPLQNLWLGTTVENQAAADERRADFQATPAAVKFVSYEPAIGPVDWSGWEFIDMLVFGGESGPGARPAHPNWFRNALAWCRENDIAPFFKQWGAWFPRSQWEDNPFLILPGDCDCLDGHNLRIIDDDIMHRVGKGPAGHLLDGQVIREWPRQ